MARSKTTIRKICVHILVGLCIMGGWCLAGCSAFAQERTLWTMERLAGPVEPVAKHALVALISLDENARMEHDGAVLRFKVDAGIPEARLLQALQEATGGPFRTLHQHLAPQHAHEQAVRSAGKELHTRSEDLIARLAANPAWLAAMGAPVASISPTPEEAEAYHALLKTWLQEHPEHRVAVQRIVQYHAEDE